MPKPTHTQPLRPAFTLIEVLVVVVIIVILASIALTLAARVTQSGKTSATQDTIRALDAVLTEYTAQTDSLPPSVYTDANGDAFPIIDASEDTANAPIEPSLALFLLTTRDVPTIAPMLQGLDASITRRAPTTSFPTAFGIPLLTDDGSNTNETALTVLDAFGNPIRFVHPRYDGGYGSYFNPETTSTVSRGNLTIDANSTDKDFVRSFRLSETAPGTADEGICPSNTPYFYSAGNDANPGTRDDNVYTTVPTYEAETASF